ncbi:MAG: Gfo/Idh/MocA family protein [Saccharofermentanales bacterium]|jgi:predicted dehydrogenase|nr:Gfo/Idh/MocA family oxidoreductase [Bacillota bacterium]
MRYGLIGCGRIAPNHIEAAKNCGIDIIAVCDVIEERMVQTSERFGFSESVRLYKDYREMLDQEDLQLVAICTESGKHTSIALDCIRAGCHVIIEKPIALSLSDADAIIEAGHKKGIVVCACHQNRFNKSIIKIREAVEEGRFGRLFHGAAHIRWNRGKQYYNQDKWRGTWEQDGGVLMNQCIHNIDLLRWMMGNDIDEVFAFTDNLNHPYLETEDLGLALIKFSNGAYGLVEGTSNVYPSNLEETLYLFGEKGTVKAGGKSVNLIEEWRFDDGKDIAEKVKAEHHEDPPNIYGFGHTPLYKDVVQAIGENRQAYITGEDGRRALELVLAIYKSSSLGTSVKLPLAEGSTLDNLGQFNGCR